MSYTEVLRKYPDSIMNGRKTIEAHVLGCLFEDMLLIKEFNIKNNDFISDEGKFYFDICKILADRNILEPTDTDVRLLCSNDVIQTYKNFGGYKRIEQLRAMIDVKNFESYLDELYKKNLYMSYYDDHVDLEKEIEINADKKTIRISYLDLFETTNMSSEEIVNFMASRSLNKKTVGILKKVQEDSSEITDDFLDRLFSGIEKGSPFAIMGKDIDDNDIKAFPWISNHIQGFTKGKVHQISGHTNVGKSTVLATIAMALAFNGEKILFASNEMGCDDFKLNFLSLVINRILKNSKLNRKKLKSGTLTDEEKEVVRKAKSIFNERYKDNIDIVSLPSSDMDLCEKYLRKYVINNGVTCFIYDVFKLNFNKESKSAHLSLIEDSLKIESMAKKFNVIAITTMQLALNSKGKLRLGVSELSNAKGVSEILTTLITLRGLEEYEMDEDSKFYIRPFKYVLDENGSWQEEKIKLDKKATYRVFEIAKSRASETSEDTGVCVLYKFYGGSGSFVEFSMCKPYSGVIFNKQ